MLAQVQQQLTFLNRQMNYVPAELKFEQHVREKETQIFIRNNNVIDNVLIDTNLDDNVLKLYPFVEINLRVEIKEFRKSSDLFNGVEIADKDGYPVKRWELRRHQGDYAYYSIPVTNLTTEKFNIGNGQFKIKLKYYCLENHHFQDWYLRNVDLSFILKSSN